MGGTEIEKRKPQANLIFFRFSTCQHLKFCHHFAFQVVEPFTVFLFQRFIVSVNLSIVSVLIDPLLSFSLYLCRIL